MQPGMTVGPYRILERVGLGGMATVFKAYDPGTDRYVAIKIVSPQFAQHPEFRERFRREAKAIVGTTCSNALEEAMNVFDRARVVFISPSATVDHLSQAGLDTFNRTVFPERILPSSESLAADLGDPAYQDFVAAFEAAYGRPCCEPYAAEAYDAAAILLSAVEQVAVLDEAGSLVIPRQMLATVVRETRGFPGVSGEIRFDAVGDRVLP